MTIINEEPHIATLLDSCAAKETGLTIYTSGERSEPVKLSYRKLRFLTIQKADRLRRYDGVAPGKIVLIHFQSHLENIVWFWSCILAGCVPALSTPLVNNPQGRKLHFKHLHHLLLDPVVITNQALADTEFGENDVLRVVTVEAIDSFRDSPSEITAQLQAHGFAGICPNCQYSEFRPKRTDDLPGDFANGHAKRLAADATRGPKFSVSMKLVDDSMDSKPYGHLNGYTNGYTEDTTSSTRDIATLMLTSGSTGSAKAVGLTHKQVFAAVRGKLSAMPLPQGTALLNWIGLDHVASLVEIHLSAMYAGLDQIHVPAVDILQEPLLFLRLLSEHKVSRSFAPNFLLAKLRNILDVASTQDTQPINLNHLLYIASGGESNDVATCARITEHLVELGAPGYNVITPGFGMTETCAGAIFNRNCPKMDIQAGTEYASSETTGSSSLLRSEGTLEIRGPIVFKRYFNSDEATQDAFTADGWFKTGDLATIDDDGQLRLVGRSKELININGVKYLPHEIEGAIERAKITGVAPSFVACFAHRPSGSSTEEIYVVYQYDYEVEDGKARTEILHSIIRTVALFASARPHVLPLPVGVMDKTTLGKLSRTKIRTSLAQGQYKDHEDLDALMLQSYRDTHFSEPRDDVERTLMAVFLDTLSLDKLEMGIDTPVLDTGVTSVDLIRLKSAAEKAFNIADIPIITIMTNTTIRSLASALKQIQTSRYEGEYNPVVTLQPKGSKTPLWLIHPGIGEILVFLGLVQYFPDRPIHALRTRGFNPGEKPFDGLPEVVSTYHGALKKQQPHGPYAIAGYSYGSMLAFEISKILEADGDTVQFLGSFNLPPHIKERMQMLDWTAGLLHIAHFCDIITEQRSEELVEELRALPQPEQVSRLLLESDRVRCAELAITEASLLNWVHVAWSLQKIGWEYDPSGSVSHMDVFYCQPLKVVARTREEYRYTKLNHWADFVRDDVRFHEVDGEHYTMIGPEHVPKFQQTLKEALAARGL